MTNSLRCQCGASVKSGDESGEERGRCPSCGRALLIPASIAVPAGSAGAFEGDDFAARSADSLPAGAPEPLDAVGAPKGPSEISVVLRRMFYALLDPRSIQWMLTIGGGLFVLGLLIWLVSWGVFQNPVILAAALLIGTLAIMCAGWWVVLATRFRIAGQALTFLACVVAPLNLWFYHAQALITLDNKLWLGGVVCCLLYIATVYVLRDPLFLFAVEAGLTLTAALFLAELGLASDLGYLTVTLLALGLISIHAERAFPAEGEQFTRGRFGMPLFWSGHIQLGLSALILLGTQIVLWLARPDRALIPIVWDGNWLTDSSLLVGALWLGMTYAYLYSDIVVRRSGIYSYLAAFCFLMAVITVVGFNLQLEWLVAILALTAVAVNLVRAYVVTPTAKMSRAIPPMALALSFLPILLGTFLHAGTTSKLIPASWISNTFLASGIPWPFVVAMVLVAVGNRISAWLDRHAAPRQSAVYFFGSAAAAILAAAGLLRAFGLDDWNVQAPWLMALPITYLVAGRLWRGHSPERPLTWVAQAATVVILIGALGVSIKVGGIEAALSPRTCEPANLLYGMLFVEMAAFYVLASIFGRPGLNVPLAATAACGALWQLLGYFEVGGAYHTMVYAVFGVAVLAVSRTLGIEQVVVDRYPDPNTSAIRGKGLAVFRVGNAIVSVALLAAFLQGLMRWASHNAEFSLVIALATAILAAVTAAGLVPNGAWRRWYTTAAIGMGGVTLLTLNVLTQLSLWQKAEIFCVSVGILLIVVSYIGRFRETTDSENDVVTVGLWLGALMVTLPLLATTIYGRTSNHEIAGIEELALVATTLVMLVTGTSWHIKATTFFGGLGLFLYLLLVVASLGWRAQVATGVYLAVGGGLVFASGIVLSVFREKLLSLPDQIAHRKGVFSMLNWR
jgi:hypothetical protein